jgi:hypothetical protein
VQIVVWYAEKSPSIWCEETIGDWTEMIRQIIKSPRPDLTSFWRQIFHAFQGMPKNLILQEFMELGATYNAV